MILTIDGRQYDVLVPSGGVKRNFQIMDGENAGRVMSGRMMRDIIGTFYNYEIQIFPKIGKYADYDELYQILSAPVDKHTAVLPYGQGMQTFEMYVASGQDTLNRKTRKEAYWEGLTVQFIAVEPQRRRGG